MAQRVRDAVRPEDTVVRWGGDEFLVLAGGLLDEEEGWCLAKRISAAVSGTVHFGSLPLKVTASVGVASRHPTDTFDADELVRRADAAMYDAKAHGRNRCAGYGDIEVSLRRPA